jgi:hypothetical protein
MVRDPQGGVPKRLSRIGEIPFVFPAAYSHLWRSITPNCIPGSSIPCPRTVADMTLHGDVDTRSLNSRMPPEGLFQQRAALTVHLPRRSLLAAECPREAPRNTSGNPHRLNGDGVKHRLSGPVITLLPAAGLTTS